MDTSPIPQVPGFELLALLGRGGMGSVYKARDVKMDRVVALKVLRSSIAAEEQNLRRFRKEVRAAGRLFHPNIVASYDAGEAEGYHFISMEYVEGESVHQTLKRRGRLPEREALSIALSVARALDFAHHQGISHRDVKPGNILLARDGAAKLCDFGLARVIDASASLTRTGTLLGTPWYMAPEQGEEGLNPRADVYALGATLYHMLVGEPPFDGPSALVILMKHVTEARPCVRDKRPEVSTEAEAIVLTAMAKDPEERYRSASRMAAAIEAVLSPRTVATNPTPLPAARPASQPHATHTRRPRRPSWAWALPFVASACAVLAWVAYARGIPVDPSPSSSVGPVAEAPAPSEEEPASRELGQTAVNEDPTAVPVRAPMGPEEEAAARLAPLEEEAKRLAGEGKLTEAAAVLDRLPVELASTEAGKKAARDAAAWRSDARRRSIEGSIQQADDLAGDHRFDEAEDLLEELSASLTPTERALTDVKLKSVAEARAVWEAFRLAKAQEEHEALHARVRPLARDRKFEEARAELGRARKEQALAPQVAEIDSDLVELSLLEAVYEDALRGVRRLAETGKTARLAKFGKEVRARAEGDNLFFLVDGASIAVRLDLLDCQDIATLAWIALDSADAETRLKTGLLFAYALDPAAPREPELSLAKRDLVCASRNERLAVRWLARIVKMEEAANEAADVADFDESVAQLFAARPTVAKRNGEIDLKYDFGSDPQAKDWEAWAFVTDGAAMPDGEWRVADGELLGSGRRSFYWKAKLVGDLVIEGTLTPEETTNAGFHVCDDRAGKAYRAAIGYEVNLPMQLRAVLGAKPTSLVRLDLSSLAGISAEGGAEQARRLKAAHVMLAGGQEPSLVRGRTYSVRLTRAGDAFTFEVDGQVVARGKDATWKGGYVALFCDVVPPDANGVGHAWNDLRIAGRLDPAWLAQALPAK